MNARVFFAAVLGLALFVSVFYFAPQSMVLSARFNLSMLVLVEVTCVCVLLRVYGPAIMNSRLGLRGWRTIFIVHSTAYALTWGFACAYMIEALRMNAYAISVTTTALAACTVAVSTFSFDLLACALFLASLLLPLLKASLFSVENGQGLAGACTLSITFFMYLARSLHRAEVDGLLNQETIRNQADALKLSNDLFRGTIDSIDEVFLTIGLDGVCFGNRSDRAARLLGGEPVGRHAAEILRGTPQASADLSDWFSLLEGKQFEFAQIISLAPTSWVDEVNQLTYRIGWFPMRSDGELKSVIMTLTDITAQLRNEEQARLAEENARVTLAISADRAAFAQFIHRVRDVLTRLASWTGEDAARMRKELHDLKGFAGVFGFTSFISRISETESYTKALADDPTANHAPEVRHAAAELEGWFNAWLQREERTLRRLRVFAPRELVVSVEHVELVRREFSANGPASRMFDEILGRLSVPNLAALMNKFEEPVGRVARRLGKNVRLDVDPACANLYLSHPSWVSVAEAMIHLVNNAVDHGIELPEERQSRGKTSGGLIKVTGSVRDEGQHRWLEIHVDDDGRGVEVTKVRTRLSQRGVDHSSWSDHDVMQTIFSAGLSTKDAATDVSGQGVGLYSLAEEVRRAGGQLTVTGSELGGARFTIRLPGVAAAKAA